MVPPSIVAPPTKVELTSTVEVSQQQIVPPPPPVPTAISASHPP
ncbi:unnamed protein product, partial [Rotaria sp. Silwood1]